MSERGRLQSNILRACDLNSVHLRAKAATCTRPQANKSHIVQFQQASSSPAGTGTTLTVRSLEAILSPCRTVFAASSVQVTVGASLDSDARFNKA